VTKAIVLRVVKLTFMTLLVMWSALSILLSIPLGCLALILSVLLISRYHPGHDF